jgi:hypothetical protein
MRLRIAPARIGLAVVLALSPSCSGSSSPNPPTTLPSAAPSVAPSVAPSTAPSASPSTGPAAAACASIGRGSVDHSCARHTPVHLEAVQAAIDRLVAQRPALFDKSDQVGPESYKVLDQAAYRQGVVDELGTAGYCAESTADTVLVKNSQAVSEEYDILLGTGHVRRGASTYRESCAPAAFPLAAEELIAYIRVHFFSIRCDDGITPPANGDNLLPVGCTGFITATPNTKDNLDVPSNLVGNRIEWTFEQEDEIIRLHDWPDQAFNKTAVALKPGHWVLCATVKGFQGCQHGEVPR